jgi:RHS repeat-associated protein
VAGALGHYEESYFGTQVCTGDWQLSQDWARESPYADNAIYFVTVFSGPSCLKQLGHKVIMHRAHAVTCPAKYEAIKLEDGTYYCRGGDWLDPEKNQGPPCVCEGNPINAATGNKFQAETDFVVPAVGGLHFSRYYNSFSGEWTHTYSRRIVYSDFERGLYSAKVFRHDGRTLHFYKVLNQSTAGQDVIERLEPILDAGKIVGWKFFTAEDAVETYDATGRLSSMTDRAGWTQTLAYDATGLRSVTDAYGRKISFAYGATGMVVTDPGLNQYQYKYNSNGKIDTVTYPGGKSRKYLYNEPSFTAGQNLPKALTGIIDENGARYATWTYEGDSAKSSEHAGGADRVELTYYADGEGNPLLTQVTDAAGGARTHNYLVLNGGVLFSGYSGTCAACSDASSSKDHDGYGNVLESRDQNGNITTFLYIAARKLESWRNESGRVTDTVWHDRFRLPTLVSEAKRRTKHTYDEVTGLLLATELTDLVSGGTRAWTYKYTGRLLESMDGPRTDVADITSYSYDTKGNLATLKNALGKVTKFTLYDENGRLKLMTDPNSLTTGFDYNGRGDLVRQTRGTEATGYDYDGARQLKLVTLPTGATIKYTYDDAHRLTDIENDVGERIHFTLNAAGKREREEVFGATGVLVQSKSATFTPLGRLHHAIDAYNHHTIYSYDQNGNIVSIADPLNRIVQFRIDNFDRAEEVTLGDRQSRIGTEYDTNDEIEAVITPSQSRVEYGVDGLGNRKTTDTADPDAISKTNNFDAAGNMTSNTEARGVTTVYTYDALNRLKSVAAPEATPITLTYDAGVYGVGHLTGAVDEAGTTTLTYTKDGRLEKVARAVDTLTLATKYKYDEVGRLVELMYPSGRILTYAYIRDKVVGMTFGGTSILSNLQYQPFGAPTRWTWGNGKIYTRQFDLNGELEKYDDANSVKTIRRDEAGRIRAIEDSASTNQYQSFDYDELDHLTKYKVGQPAQLEREYFYDIEGNRTSVAIGGQQFPYTYLFGTNFLTGVSGPLPKHWDYADPLAKTITDGTNLFSLDPYRRSSGVSNATVSVKYLPDYASRRVSKKFAGGVTVHFVYDSDGRLLSEVNAAGATLVEYVWLGDTPVAVYRQGAMNYVYADHLNTPRSITDIANVVRWNWRSEPFGSTPVNSNPSGKGDFTYNLRFPGQYFDSESGLHYNYYRDYDPQTGRYIESDPIGLDGGINTYAYVGSNPLSYADPEGLQVAASIPGPAGVGIAIGTLWWQQKQAAEQRRANERLVYNMMMEEASSSSPTNRNNERCCTSYKDLYDIGRDTPKHGKSARGNIGAEPTNPQLALANSVPVKGGSRFGRDPSTGELVAFQNHRTDERTCTRYWHGYVVTQKEMNTEQWRAGREGGFPQWPRKP